MDEPKAENHKKNAESDKQASNDAIPSQRVVQDVNAAPPNQTAATPQTETKKQHEPSAWSKIPEAIVYWLHHYWDVPRERHKKTDVAMVILTLAIAAAAFWSACIFQGQLTVARETMEAQTRPWVGNGEIEVKQPTFIVYPDNPIEARTQVDFTIDIPIKNVGNSPAFHVEAGVNGTMTEQIAAPSTMDTMMEFACGLADGNAKSVGGILFPNSPYTMLEWPANIMVPLIQINEVHRVWIAICIAYSETTSDQELHHTKLWMASWPIDGRPTEIRRTTKPTITYYSLPITRWGVIRTETD
jgi:hypothetical protein